MVIVLNLKMSSISMWVVFLLHDLIDILCRWVGAVSEFLCALHDSSYMHQQKAEEHVLHSSLESSIDKSPYVNILGDGMIAPVGNDGPPSSQISDDLKPNATVNSTQEDEEAKEVENRSGTDGDAMPAQSPAAAGSTKQQGEERYADKIRDAMAPVKRSVNKLARYQGRSVWLLAYVALVTSWPLLGSLAFMLFRKKSRHPLSAK
uniref:Uncharacterized protein n=1 Tax=Aegilops tauschii subsp. strangulata TaxID=200361 RepID=A0A453G116_AEGTS